MVKKDLYYPSADGRTQIHAIRWDPEGTPRGVIQIIHGMVEYIGRYAAFAEFLCDHGFAVTGEDHLGHGESVASPEDYGFFGREGNRWMISDIHTLRCETQSLYPEIPYFMLGHSMGSFLLRQYITERNCQWSRNLTGAVIMGTGWQPGIALKAGKLVAGTYGLDRKGTKCRLLELLAFGTYLKKIHNPATVNDWLSKDPELIKSYRSDPLTTFKFTANAYHNMFSGMEKAQDIRAMAGISSGLSLLFVSGEEDPVGGWGKSVRKTADIYSRKTSCKVSTILYPGDRHEILNETDKDLVYRDLMEFFSSLS